MRFRALGVSLGLIGAVLVSQALEIPSLQVVFVKPDTPTPVILAAGTPEELETVRFVIVEPPKYGVLFGIPPELVYVPNPGFLGMDWISFLVQNVSGQLLDFGMVQLRILRPEPVFSPAFRLEGMFTLSGPAVTLESYSFVSGLYNSFQYFNVDLLAGWNQTGFTNFQAVGRAELEGTWPAPWRLPVTSTLTFNPSTLSLTSWTVDANTMALGWRFSYFFYYAGTDPQTSSYSVFSAFGSLGDVSLTSRTKFATLRPTFSEQVLILRGPALCPDCPYVWEAEYVHKKTGFDRLSLTLRGLPIPCPGCGALQTYLDLKVTFAPGEKRVEPTLRLMAGFVACVRPFVSLLTPPSGLGVVGVEVWGMEIRCDLPGGYKGRFATSFNPSRDASVTGFPQLFEVIQLEGPAKPCCGSPGWWQLSFYFRRSSGYLLGLARSDVVLYFPISREVLLHVHLKSGLVDPSDPTTTWELTLGWKSLF